MTLPLETSKRRLQRLSKLEATTARAGERALVRASAELADACARLKQLETLLLGAAPPEGPAAPGALPAGAQMRRLLQPAADMAIARVDAAKIERQECRQRLQESRARAEAVATVAARASHKVLQETERQAHLERLPCPRKPAA